MQEFALKMNVNAFKFTYPEVYIANLTLRPG